MSKIYVRCPLCGEIQTVDKSKDAAICIRCKESYVVARAISGYEEIRRYIGTDDPNESIVFFERDSVFKHKKGFVALTDRYLRFVGVSAKKYAFDIYEITDVCAKEDYWRRGIRFGRTIPNSIFFMYQDHKYSVFIGSGRAEELVKKINFYKENRKARKREFSSDEDFSGFEHFSMEDVDNIMQTSNSKKKGDLFERYCARLLELNGFHDVKVVGGSGDLGADILGWVGKRKIVIQCKCYKGTVPYHALEQTVTARKNVVAGEAILLTSGYFSDQVKRVAPEHQLYLWDRNKLQELIETANEIMGQNRIKP